MHDSQHERLPFLVVKATARIAVVVDCAGLATQWLGGLPHDVADVFVALAEIRKE